MRCFFVFSFICLLLSGCAPYVDSRREAGFAHPIGQSVPPKIAICYAPLITNEIELQQMADMACLSKNKPAKRSETRYFNCTLMTPNTAVFDCKEPIIP